MESFEIKYSQYSISPKGVCYDVYALQVDEVIAQAFLVNDASGCLKRINSKICLRNTPFQFSTESSFLRCRLYFFHLTIGFAQLFLLITVLLYSVFYKMLQINISQCGKRGLCGYGQR